MDFSIKAFDTKNAIAAAKTGCVAIGVAFQGLFSAMQPPWVPRAIATGFLILAVLVIV